MIEAITTSTNSVGTPANIGIPCPPNFRILNNKEDSKIPMDDPPPSNETAIPSNPILNELP